MTGSRPMLTMPQPGLRRSSRWRSIRPCRFRCVRQGEIEIVGAGQHFIQLLQCDDLIAALDRAAMSVDADDVRFELGQPFCGCTTE